MVENSDLYAKSGVDYKKIDPAKIIFQAAALSTAHNFERFGNREISESRGESAYVWREGPIYRAMVIEGLGTKIEVAEAMHVITGKVYYREIAQDTLATFTNDLAAMAAQTQVVMAYFGAGSSEWFTGVKRMEALAEGFAAACHLVGANWGGGESPVLRGIINSGSAELSGSAIGIIKSEEHLVSAEKITSGDAIVIIESSGIHANGLTVAREVADELPNGYKTILPSGEMYGEALLKPTHLYSRLVESVLENTNNVRYMVNITGHGLRKLMRAEKDLTYRLHIIPQPYDEFLLIKEVKQSTDEYMYGTCNMGMGFAFIVPPNEAQMVQKVATSQGFRSWNAGVVENGPKQVIIEPLNIVYSEGTLQIR